MSVFPPVRQTPRASRTCAPAARSVTSPLSEALSVPEVKVQLSDNIEPDLWRKYLFLCSFSAVNTLTAQTIRFFSSPIASPVTGALERLLMVEEVSFVPLLDSSETDPGARFTFRKRVSEQVDVTYSIDISSTQDQTWIVDYKLRRHLSQKFGETFEVTNVPGRVAVLIHAGNVIGQTQGCIILGHSCWR